MHVYRTGLAMKVKRRASHLSPLPVDQSRDSANLLGPSSVLKTCSKAHLPSYSTVMFNQIRLTVNICQLIFLTLCLSKSIMSDVSPVCLWVRAVGFLRMLWPFPAGGARTALYDTWGRLRTVKHDHCCKTFWNVFTHFCLTDRILIRLSFKVKRYCS